MASTYRQELLDFLGAEYSLKEIDREICIYRKINEHYDIEISGAHRRNHPLDIYVWDISNGSSVAARIVEKHFGVKDRYALRELLDALIQKYSDSV